MNKVEQKIVFGVDGVARGNYAGINIWCIC